MTKKNPVILTILLVALSVVITFQTTFLLCRGYRTPDGTGTPTDTAGSYTGDAVVDKDTFRRLGELAALYAAQYPDEVDTDLMEDTLITAFLAAAGDRFGSYVPQSALNEYMSSISGNYKGIGVTVQYDNDAGALEIIQVTTDSPAERCGLAEGDLVTHVGEGEDRVSVRELGYEGSVARVRGEEGTSVTLTVLKKDSGESVTLSVERENIEEASVYWHFYEPDARVAVIRITRFETATVNQFKKALQDAQSGGAEAIIFDVRSNPGGALNAITQILDLLLPEGPIIRIKYKDPSKNVAISSDAACLKMPMAVLCNGSTASAGELFCSALKDYGVATLVGTNTFGKGTMQTLTYLSDGSAVSMTVAYYLPPFSENYHNVGVSPDIVCEPDPALEGVSVTKRTDAEDNQLRRAAEALGFGTAE